MSDSGVSHFLEALIESNSAEMSHSFEEGGSACTVSLCLASHVCLKEYQQCLAILVGLPPQTYTVCTVNPNYQLFHVYFKEDQLRHLTQDRVTFSLTYLAWQQKKIQLINICQVALFLILILYYKD